MREGGGLPEGPVVGVGGGVAAAADGMIDAVGGTLTLMMAGRRHGGVRGRHGLCVVVQEEGLGVLLASCRVGRRGGAGRGGELDEAKGGGWIVKRLSAATREVVATSLCGVRG